MSDDEPDLTKRTDADPATGSDAAASKPGASRPVAPGAAAARRARQLGGARRPSPRPTTDEATSTTATATTAATPAVERTTATPSAAPKSSVGKAAARPRPRPRPTPADDDATTTDEVDDVTAAHRRRPLVAAAGVLTVLLFATGLVFGGLWLKAYTASTPISQQQTDRAVSAAKTDVALVTSYGYQTVDTDAAKAAAVLTGEFKDQYLDAIEKTVKPQLPTTQTVTTGQVDAAGVVSADQRGRQVVVLVYGQQAVTDKAQTTPRIDAFQIRVTMQLVDGDWLVAQLEQLGNNA